ncbi:MULTISPECIES: DsbA family protein [Acidiphilium]|jgi:protein-disulfide isomerase|nr:MULTISPECIES: DsbA family protein [Acidiphilium]EGO96033.1 Protein-disulfide isomerase-like protein [Acidiphilium sp. PM]
MVGGLATAGSLGIAFPAAAAETKADSPYSIRSLGNPNAPVTVYEYFSLNCPHCAEFATHALPKVIESYVKPGKVYYVFKDFPLNEDALWAAQIARALPAKAYYPFISELFRTQDEWAYAPGLKTPKDYQNALFRYAALAGMDRTTFDAAIANKKLRAFVLNELNDAEKTYKVNSTPTFIINGRKREGAVSFDTFSSWLKAA